MKNYNKKWIIIIRKFKISKKKIMVIILYNKRFKLWNLINVIRTNEKRLDD
jgi:hypothetical protein